MNAPDSLVLLALGPIKGYAEAGATFAPAEHGLTERDVAELLGCGAVEVVESAPDAAPAAATKPAAAPAVPAVPAVPASNRKAAK